MLAMENYFCYIGERDEEYCVCMQPNSQCVLISLYQKQNCVRCFEVESSQVYHYYMPLLVGGGNIIHQ